MRRGNRSGRSLLGCFMCGLLAAVAIGLPAGSPAAATRQIDNLLLSKIIWGMPSDRVAVALKLERNQYTILHDPVEGNVTIFQLDGKALHYPEFGQVYLSFKPDTGLFKVYGFYMGSLNDTVAALKHRYGEPDEVKHTSLAQTYQWNFQETTLSVNNTQFEITPK